MADCVRIDVNANHTLSPLGHQGRAITLATRDIQNLLAANYFTGQVVSMIMLHLDFTSHPWDEALAGKVQMVLRHRHRMATHNFISISILRIGTPNNPRHTALDCT